ncbi:MAG: alcohol dehydrogenase catalytic domain-containing protein [Clostridiales Family XIII bacterium]|jgi:L-iditol 2-dehydrogenase|nr:alcohol dehydrogenase catalytic domain-containing protein [Clostridiales Family XIII bacterium]
MSENTMRVSYLTAPRTHKVMRIPIPAPAPGEVLIKVHTVGICGSDIHRNAEVLASDEYNIIQGHEMSGEIVDANGSAVFKNGDKVVAIPQTFCGECAFCGSGRNNWCRDLKIIGVHIDGFAAEYVALPERIVLIVPQDMPYETAAMIEPLAVSVHAVGLLADVRGKNVLVLGAGVIGNLAAQAAKVRGANVMIAGRTQYRLDFAKEVGIGLCVNTNETGLREAVTRAFGAGGADAVVECIGAAYSVNESFYQCRKGGTVVVTGVFSEKQSIDVFTMQDKELVVIGSMMYGLPDFREALKLASTGEVQLKPLVTGAFPLESFDDAFDAIDKKSFPVMKVMLQIVE